MNPRALGFGFALLSSPALAGEALHMKARLDVYPATTFPKRATADEITDTYFKGTYDNAGAKRQVQRVLDLKGRVQTVTTDIVQCWADKEYTLELLGITLPEGFLSRRHQMIRAGEFAFWTEDAPAKGKRPSIVGDAYLDPEENESDAYSAESMSLLGLVPSGSPPKDDPAPALPLLTSYADGPWPGPGTLPKPTTPRVVRITWRDPGHRAIVSIATYWNVRTAQPIQILKFEGSHVKGDRHLYSRMVDTSFDGAQVQARTTYDVLSREPIDGPLPDPVTKGKRFVDRRLGRDKIDGFNYNGVAFPTVESVRRARGFAPTADPSTNARAFYQILGGVGFLGLGGFLWSRARRMPK